jgi:tetratricopeptide (TPR) repeat protein
MRTTPGFLLAIAIVACAAPATTAGQQPEPQACHTGVSTTVATLPPPSLMTGIGTSHLRITTKSPLAQRFFDQGLNLLHAFWDTEAYRAFKEAARLDPDAAMAHWGMYAALGQNGQEMADVRAEALKRAVALAPRTSDHEQYYIRAASYQSDPAKGRAAYLSEMEALIDRYPLDVEAQLFLANTLSTPASSYLPDGRPREGKLYGQAILRNLLRTHPHHAAVHHYWIHAVENGPRPEVALPSVARLPQLAPASGHMLHMPGHIYYRLGRYADARRVFLKSMAFDEAYMAREHVTAVDDWNYVHNLDYLVATSAEDGRYADGLRHATILGTLPAGPDRARAAGTGYITFGGHTAVARFQIRYARWADAAATLRKAIASLEGDALVKGYYEGMLRYTEGMTAASASRLDDAETAATALKALLEKLSSERVQVSGDWYFRYAVRVLEVNALELRGAIQSARGEHDAAIAALKAAADQERDLGYWEPPHCARPVFESLGDAYRRAGRHDDARGAYRSALSQRPHSGHAMLGIARTEAAAGRRAAAARAYREFLAAWPDADRDLPEIAEARAYLREAYGRSAITASSPMGSRRDSQRGATSPRTSRRRATRCGRQAAQPGASPSPAAPGGNSRRPCRRASLLRSRTAPRGRRPV